ncbi:MULTISPECIES: acyl-CoA dehydrogenase family protein [Methylotenera]|uniref:acyl-CoA dehydrogenase family protein n=1 Tax=Methylotenera TaxID=359407 RepID=UPI00037942D0|nr:MULTISPECIES: acyl-CoA dehydrogenase family protein [Methylotenera]
MLANQAQVDARLADIERIGREIASVNAVDVDANSRFPIEAITALRATGIFAAPISVEFGGVGADAIELARGCWILGQYCSATASIVAMHHTQILSVVHHANDNVQLQDYLRRVARDNRIIASVTSEVGPGGDMRSSNCAVEVEGDSYTLTKKATTVSYGSYADDLMITARKNVDAASGDQVLVIAEKGQFQLQDQGVWDTLGMRGTCSPPATIVAKGAAWQVISTPFADIATYTMVPTSHIFWSSWWLGLATDAVSKARELFRAKGRSNPGVTPMGAHRVADLDAELQKMEYEVFGLAREYAEALAVKDLQKLSSLAFSLRINTLKLNSSRAVVAIVSEALSVCGIQAYKNNGPFSLGRHLRDAHSSVMMVHNDRIQLTNAAMLLVHKGN